MTSWEYSKENIKKNYSVAANIFIVKRKMQIKKDKRFSFWGKAKGSLAYMLQMLEKKSKFPRILRI